MITENLSTLKIHNLTKEQYERELAAGRIDENALYLTPYEETDLSEYATQEYVDDALAAVKPNITGAASTIVEANLTLDKALISDSSGKVAASSVTSEELGYLSGVTENVQDQFNTQTAQTTALTKLAMPGSLKWDGFIGDKECVVVEENDDVRLCYVHISDYGPITLSECIGETLEGFASMGGLMTVVIEENTIIPFEFTVNEDMSIITEFFVFAPVDGFALEGIVFPKKGWYLTTQSAVYMDYEIPLMYINGVNIPLVNFPDNNGGDADKYFESVEEKTYLGDALTWDGNVDGRVCIEHQFGSGDNVINAKFVKMSDSVLSVTDFVNGFTSFNNNGTQVQKSYEDIINSDMINSDGFISIASITCVPTDNYNILDVTFPEAGIYFSTDGTSYPTSFTVPGYNFVEIEPHAVIKTEHLPKALQFGEITKTVGGDTLTWDGNTDGLIGVDGFYNVSNVVPKLEDLKKGLSFIFIKGSSKIESTFTSEELSDVTQNESGVIICEALAIFTKVYNGYPAGVYFFKNENAEYLASVTIHGYTGFPVTTTELVKIDPKYLPDGFGGEGGGLPEVTTGDNGKIMKVSDGEWSVSNLSFNDLDDKPNYAGSSSVGGAATSADKLTTARTIALNGAVSGSTTFDGSKNISITTTNGQHISNKGSGTYYYKLGTMVADNSGNYGNITISGRLGGWEQSNSANFDIMMLNRSSARDGNTITATVSASGNTVGAFGNCDIVVYRQDDTSEIVYLKLSGYWLYDFDWSVFQHSVNYSATNVTPTGTLVWSLSGAPKTILDASGNFYIKGSKAATIADIESAIGTAIAASY